MVLEVMICTGQGLVSAPCCRRDRMQRILSHRALKWKMIPSSRSQREDGPHVPCGVVSTPQHRPVARLFLIPGPLWGSRNTCCYGTHIIWIEVMLPLL